MRKKTAILFVLLAFCTVSLLFAGGAKEQPAPTVAAEGEFDWRRFEGTEIVVCWPNHVTYNAFMPLLPEFEELTGIKVEVDLLQYMRMHDALVLEMSKGSGEYDLISMVVMWKSEFVEGNMLRPLQPFFDNESLAMPGYDFDDLVPAYVENAGIAGGENIYMDGPGAKLYGVPFGTETSIMVYRKDIFDEHNLQVPDTYDEMLEVAKYVYENVPGVYGMTSRGASGHQATAAWLLHASPFDAKLFDENWEPVFNSPQGVAALEWLVEMFKYGPPGMTAFAQDGQFQAFLQGQAAMYMDASVFTGVARDPQRSTVHDKLGFALHTKKENRLSETGGFGLAVPTNSSNPEAAFLLMQWMTSKDVERRVVLNGGAPFRMSTVSDPEMQRRFPEFSVLEEQLPHANPDWRPIIPEWGEVNSLLGVAINQALTGEKTPKAALDEVVAPIRQIMVRAGYIK